MGRRCPERADEGLGGVLGDKSLTSHVPGEERFTRGGQPERLQAISNRPCVRVPSVRYDTTACASTGASKKPCR